jgi:precorrin-3B C17-methyltransferase
VIVGYELYLSLIEELITGKEIISTGMTGETERCKKAIEAALSGKRVCVVSSGDAGVYGMAGLVLELAEAYPEIEVEVVPGVTAACSASAVLGAPLTHDFAAISLSDRLTEWNVIEERLRMAARGDFVICLYNPGSKGRREHLEKACSIIMESRKPETPCGIVRSAGREGEEAEIMSLEKLRDYNADMFTTIVVGSSATRVINGRLVTPRGYNL